jgi:soluble P-type ATPase
VPPDAGVRSPGELADRLQDINTFGTAKLALRALPVEVLKVGSGLDQQKFLAARQRQGVVAIGNGNNDVEMLRHSALGIAVLGPEGMAGALLKHATIVAPSIVVALDLLLEPKRILATLRR